MVAEGDSTEPVALLSGQTAVEKALADRLAVIWRNPALRSHQFFEQWFDRLGIGPKEPGRLISYCSGCTDLEGALVLLRGVVCSLDWQKAEVLRPSCSVVTDVAELATLVICQRLIRQETEHAGTNWSTGAHRQLPISSRFYSALVAAAWLDLRVGFGHHGNGQKIFVRNLLSDLPPIEYKWNNPRDALSAELNAYLNYTEGRSKGSYFADRNEYLRSVQESRIAEPRMLRAQLEDLKRKKGGDNGKGLFPLFGFGSDSDQVVGASDMQWAFETFGVHFFTYGSKPEAGDLGRRLNDLEGTIRQSLQVVLDGVNGIERIKQKDATRARPARGFICYSHKECDGPERTRNLELVSGFLREIFQQEDGLVWMDAEIEPGDEWREKIDRAIASCEVAILLISREFMGSKFVREVEIPALLERRRRDGIIIYPLLMRPFNYVDNDLLSEIQVRCVGDGMAFSSLAENVLEQEMVEVQKQILRMVREANG